MGGTAPTEPKKRVPSPWLSPSLTFAALIIGLFWYYLNLRHWKNPGEDQMAIAFSIVITTLLWGALAYALVRNLKDIGREKKLRVAIQSLKEDRATQMESLQARNAALKTENGKLTALLETARMQICDQHKLEERLAFAESQKMSEEDKEAIKQAALLLEYSEFADTLRTTLESVWYLWDLAKETLIHPISANIEVRDHSAAGFSNILTDKLVQFRVLYQYHLKVLTLHFPGFSSNTLIVGYPSDEKIQTVRHNLWNHAALLKEAAERLWRHPRGSEAGL